jgi:prepilin-type N-terminal cleavage/methylation domain-containing protein
MNMSRLAPRFSCHHRLGCRGRHRSFHGFTLVELLVVIAIIGTLVGLLLPAVQAAREAARRSQCGNNVKQWALGMQSYHDAYGVLPLGSSTWPCIQTTWLPCLWPFVEQTDLANRFKYDQNFAGWPLENTAAASPLAPLSVRIPLYYCPSDRPNAIQTNSVNNYIRARTNYATNATALVRSGTTYRGPFNTLFSNSYKGCSGTAPVNFGVRGYKGSEATRFRNITDGLSKTLMLSEINLIGTNAESPRDPRGDTYTFLAFDTSQSTPNSSFDIVANWYTPSSYSCANLPPHLPCQATGSGDKFSFVARSKHTGGVQAAFADGAVQFISNSVDLSTWQAIGTISGGETLAP